MEGSRHPEHTDASDVSRDAPESFPADQFHDGAPSLPVELAVPAKRGSDATNENPKRPRVDPPEPSQEANATKEPVEPVEPAGPEQRLEESTEPVAEVESSEPAQSTDPAKVTEAAEPGEPGEPREPAESAEAAEPAESGESSSNSDDEENPGDELDLDALMAQLQQHTERAAMDQDTNETGGGGQEAPEEPEELEELSIEQQLKGALSSLQDLDAEEDDQDDDGDAAFALDQLTQMLNERKDEESQEQPQEQPREQPQEQSQAQSQAQSEAPREPQQQAQVHPQPPQQPQQPEQRDETDKPAAESSAAKTREELLAKMPPPPPHAGPLPPMPPPPAALTSPTAPYTALELARGSGGAGRRPSSSSSSATATATAEERTLNTRLSSIYHPTFSQTPSLSRNYESELADQVDGALEKDDEEDGKEDEQAMALLLNNNQAILQARQRSIALLDCLAAQVLDVLSFGHYQETLATVMQPKSERGMAYRMLLDVFEDTKRLFVKWKTTSSRHGPEPKPEEVRPFLPHNIPGVDPTRDNITSIQRANLATFVAALFGTIEIGFWELDEWFLKIFVPENGRLLKHQATIYLDLKTQAYISAVESSDDKEMHKSALEHLFPEDLETKIKDLLGERISLAPSEQDFVAKCHRRRDNIKAENEKDLSTKYHWVPFLREISDYISRNHYTLLPQRKTFGMELGAATASPSPGPTSAASAAATAAQMRAFHPQRRQTSLPPSRPVESHSQQPPQQPPAAAAATSAASAAGGGGGGAAASTAATSTTAASRRESTDKESGDVQISSVSTRAGRPKLELGEDHSEGTDKPAAPKRHPEIPAEGHPLFPPLPKQVLPPPSLAGSSASDSLNGSGSTRQQTLERARRPGPRPHSQAPVAADSNPTDTLAVYEAAKASAEGTDAIRPKTSLFTTRRTWTKEEEEALLKGMDRVQGPYWAQILELYGPGGKINEVLKDRNQVQLKDKARNLKMFFLRLGLPIPAVFQYVTGDYETRRSSGRKVRDRKQQRAGPSEQLPTTTRLPPHQLTEQAPQVAPSPHQVAPSPPVAPSPQVPSPQVPSQQMSAPQVSAPQVSASQVSASQVVAPAAPSPQMAAPQQSSSLPQPASSEQPPPPPPSLSAGAPPSSKADGSGSGTSGSASATATSQQQQLETSHERVVTTAEVHTAESTAATPAGDKEATAVAPTSNTASSDEQTKSNDNNDINDAYSDSGDKEDISSLLNRVGAYVENH